MSRHSTGRREACGGIEPGRGIDHDVAIVIRQQVEETGQFGWGGQGWIRLLRSGKKMQSVLAGSHQAIEQRRIEAVQILPAHRALQSWGEDWNEVERADGRKIHSTTFRGIVAERTGY